ncbi:hypothetical protein DC363_15335 [Thalassorhabdomicrobium marinisediminis]|uniref:DUF2238 domain-containing protein n=1 Tax=Thalassorhabdomicrobium marinisediminis TaxID=2170577 RepID=A0A2T7FTH0_9RHOB|nr:hypothetical protein DC363_15335 [Thalassorhabdomicrobium marinisediminis]
MSSVPVVIRLIQAVLAIEVISGVLTQTWTAVFVAGATLILTFLPDKAARFFGIELPRTVLTAIVVFIFATLFLGEVANFYERFWWWDVVLHFFSALSFGAMGFLFIFMMFEGDKYAAPAWAIAVLAFCVGVAFGAIWEIFEFFMDQTFGFNMQKSGLVDTMWDLIIDTIGAAIGGFSGFVYLKGRESKGMGALFNEFMEKNRKFYRKARRQGKPEDR